MIAWQIAACCCALCSGAAFSGIIHEAWRRRKHAQHIRARIQHAPKHEIKSFDGVVFGLWGRFSLEQQTRKGSSLRFYEVIYGPHANRWMRKHACFLGKPELSAQGLSATCFLCCIAGLSASFVLAYTIGLPWLGVILFCLAGSFAFGRVPFRVAAAFIRRRCEAMEHELSQMLAMVALGLHGGLSFDRSFALYANSFHTDFAQECEQARHRWEMSLSTREEALRDLGKSYDSPLFQQAMESMIRSLRLGTALAENLEALASEARSQYRARCEEAIAKAPVKMLVPTGALILPAMLILVMGPVLLEMMNGF